MKKCEQTIAWLTRSLLGVMLLLECTPPQLYLDLTHEYTQEKFTGRELTRKVIGICPVLINYRPVRDSLLPLEKTLKKISRERKDLSVIGADSIGLFLSKQIPAKLLAESYRDLYSGKISDMQTVDTFWSRVPTDYLLVIRVIHGMDVRTFNRRNRKKFRLEAELWSCNEMEVVWRVSVKGVSNRRTITHQKLISDALEKVLLALPVTLPNYESGKW